MESTYPTETAAKMFPLPKGGGPIEVRLGWNGLFFETGFHYRKAVAPLKLARHRSHHSASGEFPLPKGGGPIEVPRTF